MNTNFLFDNIIIIPLIAVIVAATYLIQFSSVISPCNLEFDGDNRKEMFLMKRYNIFCDNAFTIYISAVIAGITVALSVASSIVLIILMIMQVIYLVLALAVMLMMHERNKNYWIIYENSNRNEEKAEDEIEHTAEMTNKYVIEYESEYVIEY